MRGSAPSLAILALLLSLLPQQATARAAPEECLRSGHRSALGTLAGSVGSITDQMVHIGSAGESVREAGIYGKDDRFVLPKPIYPYTAIGKLEADDGAWCTASLVSACHVVTAAHCVNGHTADSLTWTRSYHGASSRVLDMQAGNNTKNSSKDYAILRISGNPGIKNGYFSIFNSDGNEVKKIAQENAKGITVSGYSQDINGGRDLSNDSGVKAWSGSDKFLQPKNYIYFNGTTHKGSSGGPGWYFDAKTNTAVILFVMSKSWINKQDEQITFDEVPKDLQDMARGVAAGEFFRELVTFMREHPCEGNNFY